jgi:hypothetical protein
LSFAIKDKLNISILINEFMKKIIIIASMLISFNSQAARSSVSRGAVAGAVGGAVVGYALGSSQSHTTQTYSGGNVYRCWCGKSQVYKDYNDIRCDTLHTINGKKSIKPNILVDYNPHFEPDVIFEPLQQSNRRIGCERI